MSAPLRLTFAVALVAVGPHAVHAGDRVQVTVFGGASLLDVGRDREIYPPCYAPVPLDVPVPLPPDKNTVDPGFVPPCGPVFVRNSLGGSFVHGAGVGYRVARRAVLAGFFSTAPGHHVGTDGYSSGESIVAYHVDAALEYEPFRVEADTRPFLSFGAGRIEYRGSGTYGDDRGNWSLNVGIGSSFKLASRARLRVEVVDHVVAEHVVTGDPAHDVHARIGFTVIP